MNSQDHPSVHRLWRRGCCGTGRLGTSSLWRAYVGSMVDINVLRLASSATLDLGRDQNGSQLSFIELQLIYLFIISVLNVFALLLISYNWIWNVYDFAESSNSYARRYSFGCSQNT
ncbi:unnamed protein product [Brassica rapa subsp. narinosa]